MELSGLHQVDKAKVRSFRFNFSGFFVIRCKRLTDRDNVVVALAIAAMTDNGSRHISFVAKPCPKGLAVRQVTTVSADQPQLTFRRPTTLLPEDTYEQLDELLGVVSLIERIWRETSFDDCVVPSSPMNSVPFSKANFRFTFKPLSPERLPTICSRGLLDSSKYLVLFNQPTLQSS